MDGQFQVAQATGAGTSNNTTTPRIYKLSKPLTDQAVVVNLGYDQKVKVDFSGISNEKITLVHVGEKLIILFDNQSTVTVEPFFKSRADGLGNEARDNITVEMAPGRDISVTEFASLFPITTDTSVLPAADNSGNSNANAQATGASFSPFSIDPLPPIGTNELAPQEDLGTFATPPQTGTVEIPSTPAAPGPTITAGVAPDLIVDESFLTAATNGVAGSGQAPLGVTVATGLVPFTVDAPAGQQSLTFALNINNATTNLIDTATGQVVTLVQNGSGEVDGVVTINGAQISVFTLTVDGTGQLTLTDLRAVHENTPGNPNEGITLLTGLVSLTATVTDVNNNTASASVDVGSHLTFLDDGPILTLTATPTLGALEVVEASGVLGHSVVTITPPTFTASAVDGFTTSIDYTLALAGGTVTNLLTTAGNHPITLVVDSTTQISGKYDSDANGTLDATAFTITVVGDQVTLTSLVALEHSNAPQGVGEDNTLDISTLINVVATVTATDGDNDSIVKSAPTATPLALTFDDTDPTAISPDYAILNNAVGATLTAFLDADHNIDNNVVDQTATISFANITNGELAVGVVNGNTATLTSGGQNIHLFLVDQDSNPATPDQLQGWTGNAPGQGTEVFAVTLLPDGSLATSNDQYKIEIFAQIGATETRTVNDFSSLGQNTQQFKALDVAGTTQDLLFSGYVQQANGSSNAAGGSSVSASTTGIGVANNSMNDGDNLRIDFVNTATITAGNNNEYNYTTHYNINDFQFGIVQVNGSPPADSIEVWVRIYNADNDPAGNTTALDSGNLADDPQLNTITGISINGVALTAAQFAALQTDGNGGYLITGLDLHDTVLVHASGTGYNRIEIENALQTPTFNDPTLNGEAFDIGTFSYVTTATTIPSVGMSFDLALTDGDGDTTISDLGVTLVSPGTLFNDYSNSANPVTATVGDANNPQANIRGSSFDDVLNGNAAANILSGGLGNDTLQGNGGDDILIGGAGSDKFVLASTAALNGHDTIADLSSLDGIFIDVAGQNLNLGSATTISAGQFVASSGGVPNEASAGAWNGVTNSFFFNNTTQELWYSANGTGSDKVDLAHVSTGVPTAASVHTF
ncbi:DUF5801 repeats-in-toxin domain-containing protein [Bradyrhizobium sp. AUGA SZCCT0283]|uniref:DUF5801 repeats-in-toxin domain-containing protein n=1 Tax=Bradyrhizobium sp. AUGA SZCCT0283 TaxID=2807671 RepID=UPI001BA9160F|nr:DUF5801 repeats-in-toxin domain-containing protein [Bradyrhizobium sp. AUGA SZCCT0283]MBR1280147.1 hypothetical protein [Bradyrhizobium sp. AUGA SZCCT0283]